MPSGKFPMRNRAERMAVGKAYIDLTRRFRQSFHQATKGVYEERVDCELFLVVSAVVVGHAEDKPMSATKIAHYLELPRTTVLRKLEQLVISGAFERHGNSYMLSKPFANGSDKTVASYVSVFDAANKALSNSHVRSVLRP
jgi:hypothetical protein